MRICRICSRDHIFVSGPLLWCHTILCLQQRQCFDRYKNTCWGLASYNTLYSGMWFQTFRRNILTSTRYSTPSFHWPFLPSWWSVKSLQYGLLLFVSVPSSVKTCSSLMTHTTIEHRHIFTILPSRERSLNETWRRIWNTETKCFVN
jgi:hypothetical protein